MLFHTWPFLVFMLVVLPIFFCAEKNPFVDSLADGGFLLFLWLVESVLSDSRRLFHNS